MRKSVTLLSLFAVLCTAQTTTIPEGTKLRVRLADTLSSATAEQGQAVELVTAEAVKVGEQIVIPEGARVTGTVTEAVARRRMGRAGKLDFSIDRAKAIDNEWIPLRYAVQRKAGNSHTVRTGVITAGLAVAFWPAAPFVLLMRGKDVTIHKGISFDVYTDTNHPLASTAPTVPAPAPADHKSASLLPSSATAEEKATVTITSSTPGADIEVDNAFSGNTPSSLQLSPGKHRITVRSGAQVWRREIDVAAGSTISLMANLNESVARADSGK